MILLNFIICTEINDLPYAFLFNTGRAFYYDVHHSVQQQKIIKPILQVTDSQGVSTNFTSQVRHNSSAYLIETWFLLDQATKDVIKAAQVQNLKLFVENLVISDVRIQATFNKYFNIKYNNGIKVSFNQLVSGQFVLCSSDCIQLKASLNSVSDFTFNSDSSQFQNGSDITEAQLLSLFNSSQSVGVTLKQDNNYIPQNQSQYDWLPEIITEFSKVTVLDKSDSKIDILFDDIYGVLEGQTISKFILTFALVTEDWGRQYAIKGSEVKQYNSSHYIVSYPSSYSSFDVFSDMLTNNNFTQLGAKVIYGDSRTYYITQANTLDLPVSPYRYGMVMDPVNQQIYIRFQSGRGVRPFGQNNYYFKIQGNANRNVIQIQQRNHLNFFDSQINSTTNQVIRDTVYQTVQLGDLFNLMEIVDGDYKNFMAQLDQTILSTFGHADLIFEQSSAKVSIQDVFGVLMDQFPKAMKLSVNGQSFDTQVDTPIDGSTLLVYNATFNDLPAEIVTCMKEQTCQAVIKVSNDQTSLNVSDVQVADGKKSANFFAVEDHFVHLNVKIHSKGVLQNQPYQVSVSTLDGHVMYSEDFVLPSNKYLSRVVKFNSSLAVDKNGLRITPEYYQQFRQALISQGVEVKLVSKKSGDEVVLVNDQKRIGQILNIAPLQKKFLAPKPPMGWNAWNTFNNRIDETVIVETAKAMSEKFLPHGYNILVLDDAYLLKDRDANGFIQPNLEKFPHGFKWLADQVHGVGLKYGMYNCGGTMTCEQLAGSFGHEEVDAQWFGSFDIDFLKYDFCFNPIVTQKYAPDFKNLYVLNQVYEPKDAELSGAAKLSSNGFILNIGNNDGAVTYHIDVNYDGLYDIFYEFTTPEYRPFQVTVNDKNHQIFMNNETLQSSQSKNLTFKLQLNKGQNTVKIFQNMTNEDLAHYTYQRMGDALLKVERNNGPTPETSGIIFNACEWGANSPWLWASDVSHYWRTTYDIKENWERIMYVYDINVELDEYAGVNAFNDADMLVVGMPGLTDVNNKAHFSLWSIMMSPLILGNDLRDVSDETFKILTNEHCIAVNQDDLTVQGKRIYSQDDKDILVKPLANGSAAVLLFNKKSSAAQQISLDLKTIPGLIPKLENPEQWSEASQYSCFNIWQEKTESVTSVLEATVVPLGVEFYICTPQK